MNYYVRLIATLYCPCTNFVRTKLSIHVHVHTLHVACYKPVTCFCLCSCSLPKIAVLITEIPLLCSIWRMYVDNSSWSHFLSYVHRVMLQFPTTPTWVTCQSSTLLHWREKRSLVEDTMSCSLSCSLMSKNLRWGHYQCTDYCGIFIWKVSCLLIL